MLPSSQRPCPYSRHRDNVRLEHDQNDLRCEDAWCCDYECEYGWFCDEWSGDGKTNLADLKVLTIDWLCEAGF